jgi:glycosyltransferase involved in cell wall biosynthesis
VLTLLATIGSGRPVVVSERSDPTAEPLPRVWRWLRAFTYRRASSIVVQTQGVGEIMRRTYGNRVDVIPNSVATPPGHTAPVSIRETWILAAGRFTPEKGFDLLLRAFAAIAPTHHGWGLRIAGDGPRRDEWQALAKALDIADRVEWLGTRHDLPALFARCGVFVLSSRYEGFPNVLCEAMAAGAPIVAFDCPSGPADIVRHKVDGLLVAREDAEQLSAALLCLVNDRTLRAALGANARDITQRFSTGDVMRRWEAVLLKPS